MSVSLALNLSIKYNTLGFYLLDYVFRFCSVLTRKGKGSVKISWALSAFREGQGRSCKDREKKRTYLKLRGCKGEIRQVENKMETEFGRCRRGASTPRKGSRVRIAITLIYNNG